MHSRDATVLIDLLWFNVVHYSSLFLYFFKLLWSLLKLKIPNFLVYYNYLAVVTYMDMKKNDETGKTLKILK